MPQTPYEVWESLADTLGEAGDFVGRLSHGVAVNTQQMAIQASGADVLGYRAWNAARLLKDTLTKEDKGILINKNVRVLRYLDAVAGNNRNYGLYDETISGQLDAAEDAEALVNDYVGSLSNQYGKKASATLRAATSLIRPVTLAMTPLLMATDSALRGFTIGNKYGSIPGFFSDIGNSTAQFIQLYGKAFSLNATEQHYKQFRLANRAAMHVLQEFATRHSDDVFMSQKWNRATKGVGDALGYNATNQAALLAARVRTDTHAAGFAHRTFRELANSSDTNERLFFSEYLGTQVPEASWDAFVKAGGDMEKLTRENSRAALDMESTLVYRAKFLSGEQTTLQRQGRLPQELRGTTTGEFVNTATMFTSYVMNMTEVLADRLYTLNRAANAATGQQRGINREAGIAFALAAGMMMTIGGMTIYGRDYLAKGRELDLSNEKERNKFIGKSIAYSNAFGIVGDLIRAGIEGAQSYNETEGFVTAAVTDRVPGLMLMGGLVSDILGIGETGVKAFYEGKLTKEYSDELKDELSGITRLTVPTRHFFVTPVVNQLLTDAEKETFAGRVISDRP